jgi:hypothetical protein
MIINNLNFRFLTTLTFGVSIFLISLSCEEKKDTSADLEKEKHKLREEREALEKQKRQKEISDSIEANTLKLLDEVNYSISNNEIIKLFNVTRSSLGKEFVNETNPTSKPTFEIIGKQFYTIGSDNYLLAVMGITNPNDYHVNSGKQIVGLFKYEADQWNRIDILREVSVSSGFGNYGALEKFHVFGQQNVAVAVEGGYAGQGVIMENRAIVGVVDEKLYEIYAAQKSHNDDLAIEMELLTKEKSENQETKVSFQKMDNGFYELKEIKTLGGKNPKTKILSFNSNKMKYQ